MTYVTLSYNPLKSHLVFLCVVVLDYHLYFSLMILKIVHLFMCCQLHPVDYGAGSQT